ncbi:MAG: pantetheine-phosphate adenylyltransferase [Clostridiales bacterium]|nr:pantetheine-phosphate adenylyltransferase [Clostridiales bacterium]MBR6484508.1 pantetheine-phosphate adenylyltransferase [Clostridiales bacterium]
MTTLLFPGSFDPFTRGHRDIARRAARICDKLYVAIMNNDSKKLLFTSEERVDMARKSLSEYPNIEVISSDGLTVDVFRETKANAVVRGIRSESDFRYEAEMALANRLLYPEYDVVLLPCRDDLSLISSSIVKEVGSYGGDISKMVPAPIVDYVNEKLKKGRN